MGFNIRGYSGSILGIKIIVHLRMATQQLKAETLDRLQSLFWGVVKDVKFGYYNVQETKLFTIYPYQHLTT